MQEMQTTQVRFLGQEDPWEWEVANHSNILTWKISWIKSLAGYSPWDHRESHINELC